MDEINGYPSDWLDDIDAAVAAHPALLGTGGAEPLRPTRDELRALLDVGFFAGLHEEEGRRVSFDLALVERDVAARAAWGHLAFDRPLPLDARRLAKLALAAHAGDTGVAVEPTANGLQIWGLVHLGAAGAPRCLLVRGQRPGVVTVEIAGDTLFRYAFGRGALPFGRLDHGQRLSRLMEPLVDVAALRGVARHVVANGSGGALLVLPEIDGAPVEERFDELRYRVSGPAADLLAQPPWGVPPEDAYAFVGRLAAVDGAVLLTSALRVVAFGAFVKSPAQAGAITLVDAAGRPQAASSLKGARHKSALWFCQAWPAALALVVSQDGEISLYVRRPEGVVVVERDVDL